MKYVTDKFKGVKYADITVPEGGSFDDLVAWKGKKNIGEEMDKAIAKLAEANDLRGVIDNAHFNDEAKLGSGKEMVDKLTGLIAIFQRPEFNFANNKAGGDDILGDAYEYLIGMYAATAGKKAGEFYTPQSVSKLLSLLATDGLKQTKAVCDCACGSGSLLLQVGRCLKVGHYYGNECNPTTYNLARMNMILHNIHYEQFDIRHTDTITDGGENSSSWEEKYQVQVANPPYSQKWSASDKYMKDDRFSPYGKLAPKSYEDMAFLEHMIFHMADADARIAVLLPHGVLFRGGAEEAIRTYIVKNLNYLDAVIGLAPNCFYGTSIPVSLLVLKNDRGQNKDNILFIDASKEYEPGKNQNSITEENVQKILNAYKNRKDIEKFCHVASMKEIEENGYNLNITRYVDTFDEEPELDLAEIDKELKEATAERDSLMKEYEKFAKELGI